MTQEEVDRLVFEIGLRLGAARAQLAGDGMEQQAAADNLALLEQRLDTLLANVRIEPLGPLADPAETKRVRELPTDTHSHAFVLPDVVAEQRTAPADYYKPGSS